MGNVSQAIFDEVYTQQEVTFGIIPTSTGTATLAAGNAMRHTKCVLEAQQGDIPSSDKTGSISQTVGATGQRGGTWSLDWEARPNGAAGSLPDFDPILVAAFGAAGTVVGATSVTYNLANVIKSFVLWHYRVPSSVMQKVSLGTVLQQLGFAFEQNANCRFTASGTSLFVLDSLNYPIDTTANGGLSSYPAKPTPTTNGTPVNGLTGTASLDGGTTVQIKSASISLATAIEVPRDRLFAGAYGSSPERDRLTVSADIVLIDEDTAAVTSLYAKALARTAIDIILTAGSVAGSRIEWTLKNCILPMPSHDDSARKWAANLRGIRAYPTTATALNEVKVKFY